MKTPAFLFAALMLVACKDEEPVPVSLPDYGYFPIVEGSWIVYDVDSTVHLDIDDQTNQPDTSIAYYHYQVRETIDSSFVDGEGEVAFRIRREIRDQDTLPWEFLSIWTCKRNSHSAQKVEENVRFVKLSFPVSTRLTWDGNAYNTLPEEEYHFSDIHVPATVGSFVFDSTVTVNQIEFISLINRIIRKEQYAMGVGLVARQRDSININGLGEKLNGLEFSQIVVDYGP